MNDLSASVEVGSPQNLAGDAIVSAVKRPILLDLGAGPISPPGYTPLGHAHGTEIYPLPYDDNSVEVVRASHVLEHFPHAQVDAVIREWIRVLKPGGVLRIAVPDFELLAKRYLDGKLMDAPAEHFVMGGQIDESDYHRSLFDREHLRQRLAVAGMVLLRPWKSEIEDCASFDVSLNIEGTKPAMSEIRVSAAMSVPRLGFMDNFGCAIDGLVPLGVKLRRQGGAFWGQALTGCLEKILEQDGGVDAILTLDYDTIFIKSNAARLLELMMAHPEADCIVAIQSSRHLPTALFTKKDENGKPRALIGLEELAGDLMPIDTAHFGLTLIRASKLRDLPKPWFLPIPDSEGRWGDGKVDEDINFWVKWRAAGNTLMLANRVVIGHAELMIRWPGPDLQAKFQSMREFNEKGPPEDIWK